MRSSLPVWALLVAWFAALAATAAFWAGVGYRIYLGIKALGGF